MSNNPTPPRLVPYPGMPHVPGKPFYEEIGVLYQSTVTPTSRYPHMFSKLDYPQLGCRLSVMAGPTIRSNPGIYSHIGEKKGAVTWSHNLKDYDRFELALTDSSSGCQFAASDHPVVGKFAWAKEWTEDTYDFVPKELVQRIADDLASIKQT